MDELFPQVPEDLTALSVEDLEGMLTQIGSTASGLADATLTIPEGVDADAILSRVPEMKDLAVAIKAELAARAEAEAAGQAELASLAAEASVEAETLAAADDTDTEGDDTDTGDDAGDTDADSTAAVADADEAVVAEAEAVVAAAAEPRRLALPGARRQHLPITVRDRSEGTPLVAAIQLPGMRPGDILDDNRFAQAVIDAFRSTGPNAGKVLLASVQGQYPEERRLDNRDPHGAVKKLRESLPQFMSEEALVASGGLCAPLTPFYDLPQFAVTDRPVRDALPSYNAVRGGVTVPTPGTIGDITTAITVITEAEDAEGGSAATKSCQDVDCPDFTDVAVTIISHCRTYGNLGARAWPEQVAFENGLTMAAHARTAETLLLDRIKALSINVTTADVYSAVFDMIYAITRAAAGIRYRLRMRPGARFRVLLPDWLPGLLQSDFAATQFDRFKSREQIEAILSAAGVTAAWYIDNVTGAIPFAAETASALDDFPDTVQWAMFPEGAFIHVDGGTLELGIVRDSTLNATNDYQVFGETFENVARIAPAQAALWVTSTVCPSGEFPALTTALSC